MKTWRNIISAIIITLLFSCCSVKHRLAKDYNNITLISNNMEHFDIKNFEDNQIGNSYTFKRDGIEIERVKSSRGYFEYQRPDGKFYEGYRAYYLNGKPKENGVTFRGIRIGKWKFYDEDGKESIINEDEKFGSFDYEKLLLYLHDKGCINIKNGEGKKQLHVFFHLIEKNWRVFVKGMFYLIDGNTGKILKEEKYTPIM